MSRAPVIVPELSEITAPYWEGARVGTLLLQTCRDCGTAWHPPQPICPQCQSSAVDWQPATGKGTLYSYTIVHHAVHSAVEDHLPYLVALVDLAEGPRIITTVIGASDTLRVGMQLTVAFRPIPDSHLRLPVFEPAG